MRIRAYSWEGTITGRLPHGSNGILPTATSSLDWDMQQFDVKQAFLHGILKPDEVQFMAQPKGFEVEEKEDWVWRVEKGLYGMHQAGHIWNKTMHDKMIAWGFHCLDCKYCVYARDDDTGSVLTAVHVDDFVSIASTKTANDVFKQQMKSEWTIAEGDADCHRRR